MSKTQIWNLSSTCNYDFDFSLVVFDMVARLSAVFSVLVQFWVDSPVIAWCTVFAMFQAFF